MIGIIRNGGFPSLYAGWGAVLCRNVPHSIIKVSRCFNIQYRFINYIAVADTNRFPVTKVGGEMFAIGGVCPKVPHDKDSLFSMLVANFDPGDFHVLI